MGKRRGRKPPPKTTPPPAPPSAAESLVTPTEIVLPGEALLHKGGLLPSAPWTPPPDDNLGQAPRGFDSHGRRTGATDQVELRADGEVIATVEIEPPLGPTGTYDDFVEKPAGEDALPALLPPRLLRWMERSTQGVLGDLQNALVEAKWQLAPPGDPMTPNGSERWRAFPPGAFDAGWPFVPLPATLDSDRETRNLVVALRRIGTFDWEDR